MRNLPHLKFPPPGIKRLSLCVNNSCRVYQDSEVNITQKFTSETPVSLPPKRNLPNSMAGILELDPDSVVFYVGGYPEDFTVTRHCRCFIIPACITHTGRNRRKDLHQTKL